MATEAARYGQQACAGGGRNGRQAAASTAAPAVIRAASTNLSSPDLTSAFQLACSAAPIRTTSMTSLGMVGSLGRDWDQATKRVRWACNEREG